METLGLFFTAVIFGPAGQSGMILVTPPRPLRSGPGVPEISDMCGTFVS